MEKAYISECRPARANSYARDAMRSLKKRRKNVDCVSVVDMMMVVVVWWVGGCKFSVVAVDAV